MRCVGYAFLAERLEPRRLLCMPGDYYDVATGTFIPAGTTRQWRCTTCRRARAPHDHVAVINDALRSAPIPPSPGNGVP